MILNANFYGLNLTMFAARQEFEGVWAGNRRLASKEIETSKTGPSTPGGVEERGGLAWRTIPRIWPFSSGKSAKKNLPYDNQTYAINGDYFMGDQLEMVDVRG